MRIQNGESRKFKIFLNQRSRKRTLKNKFDEKDDKREREREDEFDIKRSSQIKVIITCNIMSFYVISCHFMSFYDISCHFM